MKYLKKHRFTTLVIIAFTVVVLILAFVWRAFFSNGGNPVYGNRLDGMEKVEISKKTIDEVSSELKKNDKVKKAVENYEVLTGDEEVKRLSEIRLMSNLEEKSALHCAREEGREEGKKETEQKLKEIAQKLKEQKMPIKQIAEITGLSEKEIEALEK